MNLIVCGMSSVLYYLCYHPPKFEDINGAKSKAQQLKELDYFGLVLYAGGAISLLLGFGEPPPKSVCIVSYVLIKGSVVNRCY